MKENKNSKKGIIIALSIILGLVLIAAIVLLVMYFKKPKYEIKINTDGHEIVKDIVIEDNIIKELPELKLNENEEFVTWLNKNNEAMRPNLKLSEDDEISPIIESKEREKVTLKFVSGTDEKIPDIVITKGSKVILPVKPTHKTWTFLYWVDKEGYIVLNDRIINEDTTIYAYWFKSNKKEVTISFDTDTDEKIADIKLVQGDKIVFPKPTKNKKDYIFNGWLDEEGNLLDGNYIVLKNMLLKANWKNAYTCPEGCIPSEDGKTCTHTLVVDPIINKVCEGTIWHGYCLDFNNKESGAIRQCAAMGNDASDEVWYTTDTEDWCVKKMPWSEKQTCPTGYEIADNKCAKQETIECTINK